MENLQRKLSSNLKSWNRKILLMSWANGRSSNVVSWFPMSLNDAPKYRPASREIKLNFNYIMLIPLFGFRTRERVVDYLSRIKHDELSAYTKTFRKQSCDSSTSRIFHGKRSQRRFFIIHQSQKNYWHLLSLSPDPSILKDKIRKLRVFSHFCICLISEKNMLKVDGLIAHPYFMRFSRGRKIICFHLPRRHFH